LAIPGIAAFRIMTCIKDGAGQYLVKANGTPLKRSWIKIPDSVWPRSLR